MPKPTIVEDGDLEWLIKVTGKGSKHALRNVALCYTLFGTGMTPSEIALLRVSDYLASDGSVMVDTEVRAEIAFNERSRPLCWTNKKLVKTRRAEYSRVLLEAGEQRACVRRRNRGLAQGTGALSGFAGVFGIVPGRYPGGVTEVSQQIGARPARSFVRDSSGDAGG